MPASSAQRSSSRACGAAAGEGGVGDGERLGLGPAAEVLLDLVLADGLAGEVGRPAGRPRPRAPRRSWPTACTSAVVGVLVDAAAGGPRLGRDEPGELARACSSVDFASVTASSLRSLVSTPAALLAAAVDQHQRDVGAPAPRRSRAGRRRTPRGGPRGRGRPRTGWPRTARARSSRPAWPASGRPRAGSESSASASWPRTAARTAWTVRSPEELLLAGHQGDPAEHVGCARTCHGRRPYRVVGDSDPHRPRPTTATSPSRSVRSTSTPGSLERPPASRGRGGRSRCRRPPRPAPGWRRARAASRVLEPAAVVGHLETSTASPGQARAERQLARRLDVAGEQHPDPVRPRPAARRWRRWGCRPTWPGRRPQHLEGRLADDPGGAVRRVAVVGLDLAPPARPSLTPASAVDVVGVGVGQHQQRHPLDAEPVEAAVDERGVRARRRRPPRCRGRSRTTSASPWPTSQATSTQPRGGQPGDGQPDQHQRPRRSSQQPRPVAGRRSSGGSASGEHDARARSAAPAPTAPVPQPTAGSGSAAPRSATSTSQAAHQPAAVPEHPAAAGRRPARPARRQPQHGRRPDRPARRQVGGDRDQADLARRSPRRAGCRPAAPRAVRRPPRPPSAGSHRRERVAQPGREQQDAGRSPRTDSAKPTVTASPGSSSSSTDDGHAERPRARGRGRRRPSRPGRPCPSPRPGPRSARCAPAARSRRCPTAPTT